MHLGNRLGQQNSTRPEHLRGRSLDRDLLCTRCVTALTVLAESSDILSAGIILNLLLIFYLKMVVNVCERLIDPVEKVGHRAGLLRKQHQMIDRQNQR